MTATSAATSFHATWRIGRNVQEIAAPHRRGVIKAVQGTGNNADILVNFTGHPPVSFHPAQLKPL